jgi:hypothetical protein
MYGYESLKEELPSDMPVPHGQSMTMRVFVDAIMLEIKRLTDQGRDLLCS